MDSLPCPKRPRVDREGSLELNSTARKAVPKEGANMLMQLLDDQRWIEVIDRVNTHPQEAISCPDPSPLAVACRNGAPYECIRVILEAAPHRLRHVLDSRGTPLHEAIVCENIGVNVIEVLLRVDEALGSESTRATLLQDVDGFTPLHLLIRRRFQSHILRSDDDTSLMQILEMLVRSCPEAVVIPDRGEYEEPPIVYALKANIYAPALGSEDSTLARVELQIYEMVDCMLKHCPEAASQVFTGYRGQYTALHSAVFHGRYTSTIDLILNVESQFPSDRNQQPALLSNTQGELPLHFCAMRGERPRSVALICQAAPLAVFKRDASGLTPVHWLWIRYLSTLLALDDSWRGNNTTMLLETPRETLHETNRYNEYTWLERGNFDDDLQLIKRFDPPVDFLRMRHIPLEVLGDAECLQWAERSVEHLQRIRERYYANAASSDGEPAPIEWNRQDAVMSLFWTKVVSILEAAKVAGRDRPQGNSVLVHTAFASSCCLPSVVYIVALLYPEELLVRDDRGRLPLHYAASRQWHAWDWPHADSLNEPTAARLLQRETILVFQTALTLSRLEAARIADNDNRLVLHLLIDTYIKASMKYARSSLDDPMLDMLSILRHVVGFYPEALQRRDGVTKLYPFLQATAIATDQRPSNDIQSAASLSFVYELLRENPTILNSLTTRS